MDIHSFRGDKMKKCKHCNAQVDDETKFCPYCGEKLEEVVVEDNPYAQYNYQSNTSSSDYSQNYNSHQVQSDDAFNFGFAILSFFFPIVGLILFCVWNKESPKKAKGCGIAALISVILNILFGICCAVIVAAMGVNGSLQ